MKATRPIFIVTNNCLPKSLIYRSPFIMPKARRSSYNRAFKLKVVAEAEAVESNSEIAREYGLSPWSVAGTEIRPNSLTVS